MNEFRKDIASDDWVIIAPGRAARPRFLEEKKSPRKPSPRSTCPFEDLERSGNGPAILTYPDPKRWRMVLVPNKYPALVHAKGCSVPFRHGIYEAKTGVGKHELLITRDHEKNFPALPAEDAYQVLHMIQNRYRMAKADPCSVYGAAFWNWGPGAGASIWHPHYQILILPIVPPHVMHSLRGAKAYFERHHRCVRCDVIKMEKKEGTRVVEENEHAIAITPYASKIPFEVRILPKKHFPKFLDTPPAVMRSIALITQSVLRRVKRYVNDPDHNVFIHEAPFDHDKYAYHHWHLEILPKVSTFAGFELSTGIEINIIAPESAASILRGKHPK